MEDLLNQTRSFFNEAFSNKQDFSSLLHKTWVSVKDQIRVFYTAPRLIRDFLTASEFSIKSSFSVFRCRLKLNPYHAMILSVKEPSAGSYRKQETLAKSYLQQITGVLDKFDTKETSLFFS